jgi:transcription initiation factor TFIIB
MASMRDATEANLLYVASEIERMGDELSLCDEVTEFGLQLYVQAVKSGYRPSTIDRATATCLYFSARFRDAPVTIDDIADVSRRKAKNIYHESSTLSDAIGMQIEPDDPADYVEEFASELGWDEESIERAEDLCEIAKENHIHSGRSPSGIAAAVLYARSELDDLGYTQGEIGDVADTTTVTIRNSYPEIMQYAPDVEPEDLASRDFDLAFQVIEDNVDLPDHVCETARERARNIDDAEVARGQSKAGIAAAAYLVVAQEEGIDLERSHLAEVTGISPQTVSKYTGVV